MTDGRRLLLVHAHPDDESINNGATMARAAAGGDQVTVVTCTLGEYGEVLVPDLALLAAEYGDQLGGYRMAELAAAMGELGVTDHRYLGGPGRWSDSGMMGTGPNDNPRAFWQADIDEAAGELVRIIREVRPQVVVTYDERGGYGHPDHIQAHRVAMAALDPAADPAYRPELGAAWTVSKVYWNSLPRSILARALAAAQAAGMDFMRGARPPGEDDRPAVAVEDLPMGTDDALVTTAVDGRAFRDRKWAAMLAHATQITPEGQFFELRQLMGEDALSVEYYQLVRGTPGPREVGGWEADLFAGLDLAG